MDPRDPYAILQIPTSATQSQVEAAYRRLALIYHPDRNRSPGATRRMQDINWAFSVLGDLEKRHQHDRERWLYPAPPSSAPPYGAKPGSDRTTGSSSRASASTSRPAYSPPPQAPPAEVRQKQGMGLASALSLTLLLCSILSTLGRLFTPPPTAIPYIVPDWNQVNPYRGSLTPAPAAAAPVFSLTPFPNLPSICLPFAEGPREDGQKACAVGEALDATTVTIGPSQASYSRLRLDTGSTVTVSLISRERDLSLLEGLCIMASGTVTHTTDLLLYDPNEITLEIGPSPLDGAQTITQISLVQCLLAGED